MAGGGPSGEGRRRRRVSWLRNGVSDAPQRTSPVTPRSSRMAKTGGNETDSAGITPTRTPTERILKKKRPDELKKTKEQLSASEARRRHTQQVAKEAKQQEQDASSNLEDLQRQLAEFSATEESRLQELRKVQQGRDRAWQSDLEALQKQQSVDTAALSSAMSEIQRLKLQLEATTQSDASRTKQCESADSELEGLKQEMELHLATIEGLKVSVSESDKTAAETNATATENKLQLETAKTTIGSFLTEGVRLQEHLRSKDIELRESKAQAVLLEEDLKKAHAAADESLKQSQFANANGGFGSPQTVFLKSTQDISGINGGCGSSDQEIEHLRTALEVAEMRYKEEQTQMIIETKTSYEMLERVKSEYTQKVFDLALELKSKNNELMAANAVVASKVQDVHMSDGVSELQPDLEAKLIKSITDIAELKANLMDKENALQSMAEENETSSWRRAGRKLRCSKGMRWQWRSWSWPRPRSRTSGCVSGYVTEEADKSSRRAARALEQLDAAQTASAEADAELRRLRVQSDQWRKAAEATAAALASTAGGHNNKCGRLVECLSPLEHPELVTDQCSSKGC